MTPNRKKSTGYKILQSQNCSNFNNLHRKLIKLRTFCVFFSHKFVFQRVKKLENGAFVLFQNVLEGSNTITTFRIQLLIHPNGNSPSITEYKLFKFSCHLYKRWIVILALNWNVLEPKVFNLRSLSPMLFHSSERESFFHQLLIQMTYHATEVVRFLGMKENCFVFFF